MKITWKVVYAFLCFLAVFLIPLAYADEDVSVYFSKDGERVEAPAVGDKVMVHSEIVGASSSDHITLTLQDSSLKFSSNPGRQTTDVYGRYAEDNVWIYEAEVEVLSENPTLPQAHYVRDRSQPELESTEKPTGVSIDLNSEQIVSPGDTINAKATLEPSATVDSAYYNYLEWSVTYGDQTIELDKPRGEAIEFTIPDAALNNSVEVKAVLKGQECGLNADIAAKTVKLKVNDESLSIRIFPSTDNEGVVLGKYVGFSSELLRNGKVAEESAREGITYWWTAQIGQQYVNGQKRNTPTYVISPEETGTLTVYLTVTLSNGITLESNHVTKTVINSDNALESVEIKQIENGEVAPGDTIGVTYTLNPSYVTNLDGAKYEWKAVSGDKTIATSDKLEDFNFTAQKSGIVSVTLTITLNDKDPIESNTLDINVVDVTPTKIYSGDITTDQDTNNLKVGDTLTLNAELVTEGGENISYSWKATGENGETLGESKDSKSFSFTPQKAENVLVTMTAEVTSQSSVEDIDDDGYKAVKLMESYSFKDKGSEEVSGETSATGNDGNGKPSADSAESNGNDTQISDSAENAQSAASVTNNASDGQNNVTDPVNASEGKIIEGKIKTDSSQEASTGNEAAVDLLNQAALSKESPAVDISEKVTAENKGQGGSEAAVENSANNGNEVEKIKTEIAGSPNISSETSTSTNKPTTENATKQKSEVTTSGAGAEGSSVIATNNGTTGTTKTSSSNSTPAVSQSSSSKGSSVQTVSSTSTPKGAQSSGSSTTNVFNQSSNVVNPKTGANFTIGQLLVISVCSLLILISITILFRRRHQS